MQELSLGPVIKDLRLRLGMTQKQLAEGICTQAEISRIESGKNVPCVDILYAISRKCGVTMNYFFSRRHDVDDSYILTTKETIRDMVHEKRYEEVRTLVEEAIENPCFQDPHEQKFLWWHKGIIFYYLDQDDVSASKALQYAISMKTSALSITEIDVEIMITQANILLETGMIREAIRRYETCLAEFKRLSEKKNPLIYIRILYNMGLALDCLGKYQEAIERIELAIKYCKRERTLYLLGELYYQLSFSQYNLNKVGAALEYATLAYSLFRVMDKADRLKNTENLLYSIKEKLRYGVML
ncbi:helix-turn-helix domain-containing protein [Desmospora profundinema]|uniref:Transcriptional regulator with XRE-family HTH domain n=1 Tax=Desmospora profundinema TaxID=1571184 RepID=A0ABU1IT24_9BACL|nr:helix-turn-helix domain-containing protein [Desmospora profundinema]MDR6227349.1 transcriptional regulator with XRE-family HTH domain [Desmospora profundinema]